MAGRKFRGLDDKPGWINRELADIRRELREQRAAKTLQSAAIGKGGIIVDGGHLVALYPPEYGGGQGVAFGPYVASGSYAGNYEFYGLVVQGTTGDEVFQALVDPTDGSAAVYIGSPQWQATGPRPLFYGGLDGLWLSASSSGAVTIMGGAAVNGADSLVMSAVDGIFLQNLPTSASAANAVLDPTSGQLSRSTSSRRYKTDIADAGLDAEILLELTPRRFRTKAEVTEHGDDAPEHVGFIAEEAADLGLEEFVTRDVDGPEAFSYATYVTGLQAIVRHQAQQIADLTTRLERLEQTAPHEEG